MHDHNFISAPKPECTSDPECPSHLACIQEKCQDPCFSTVCGLNAECRASNHRALCVCRTGFTGDPYTVCEERKSLWFWNYICTYTFFSFFTSIINNGIFYTAGCKSDSECQLTQTCLNRECVDPCLFEKCGINAQCSAKNHRAVCACLPDYKPDPDPYIRCKQYECLSDPDCVSTLACVNEKCVNPCQCARFADCSVRNHKGICTCFPGYEGNPYGVSCTPSKQQFSSYIY